jgi:hypothetical protein
MGLTKNLGWLSKYITADGGGQIGIGITPSQKLHIYNSGDVDSAIQNTAGVLRLVSSSGINYIQSGAAFTSGSSIPLVFGPMFNVGEWMRITSTGNVGIGTANPTAKLHINESSYGTGLLITTSSVSGADITLTNTAAGGKRWDITSGGPNNGIGAGGLQFYNNTDGVMRMGIATSGNVLISTTTDTGQKLQVAGLANIYSSNSSFQQSTNTAASGSNVTFNMGSNYGQGTNGDNIAGLVIISINEASTNIANGNAVYVGTIINPRGSGSTLTQISKVQGAGVTSFSVVAGSGGGNAITVNATLSSGATYRANLTFIGGGGTS